MPMAQYHSSSAGYCIGYDKPVMLDVNKNNFVVQSHGELRGPFGRMVSK